MFRRINARVARLEAHGHETMDTLEGALLDLIAET